MNKLPTLRSLSPLIPAGDDVEKAIEFYEKKLGFTATHKEGNPANMAIVERDGVAIFLIKNGDKHLAEGTSLRIQVDGIEQFYEEIQDRSRETIHPNGTLETKPWGTNEFAVLDLAGVCIAFYEFPK